VDCLSSAIAEAPDRPYYLSWLSAAESLFQSTGLIEAGDFAARVNELTALEPGHDHAHHHENEPNDHPAPAAD
jgi:hypothetical protein